MNEYIFDEHEGDQEFGRLRMIEEACDPATFSRLEQTGIRAGWRCLELGAGAGSVMKWMGGLVGSDSRVVGVDRNAAHLRSLCGRPFEIIEGDLLDIPLETDFDVAHCRYVLIHNRRSDELLRTLCDSLKPGGFLVVEEPDFTSARLLNTHGDAAQQRVNNAIGRMFAERELDPGFGLTLPARVAARGVRIIDVDSHIHLERGGSPLAHMMGASARALADRYLATGEASEADIETYIENTGNDQFWSVWYSTVSVIGTR